MSRSGAARVATTDETPTGDDGGVRRVRAWLGGPSVAVRALTATVVMWALFFAATVVSHFLAPSRWLAGNRAVPTWEGSGDFAVLAAQIFAYNLISVAVIAGASLFANRRQEAGVYLSVGYVVLFTLAVLNGIVLGTWSFAAATIDSPSLGRKVVEMFALGYRAGLWEMTGQAFIAAALARVSIVRTTRRGTTTTRSWRAIRLDRGEWAALGGGLMLMITGALIESAALVT